MAGSSSSSSSTTGGTTTTAATSSGPSSHGGALFSLPPPVDFDAIRRKQRALTQAAGSAGSASSSQMNSPAAASYPHPQQQGGQQHGGGNGSSSSGGGNSAVVANQFASITNQGNGVNGQSGGNKYPMNASSSSSHDPDAFQAALDQLMASNDHSMGTPNNPNSQPNVFAPSNHLHHHHHQQQQHQAHGGPPRQPSTPSTPSGGMLMAQQQQQHGHMPHSHPHPPHHHHHHHHLHPQAQGQPAGPPQFGPSPSPMSAEDHARLLSSASQSFNSFAMDLSRSQQAALNMQYVDPSLAACIGGVRNAAQTLCNDLAGISAALRSSAMWRGPGGRPSMGPNGAPNQWWPNDLASVFAQMQGQQSADSSTDSQPRGNGQRGNGMGNSNDPNMLLNFLDQNQGLPPSLPPGPAEQMLDFLTHPSSGIAHDVNGGGGGSSSAGPSNPKKRSADSSASPAAAGASSSAAGPSASKIPKAAGKHKSRPPIEGVRRESVRYRNRKLLVDMREQLYKWLDTTEFCRIARSYPQGSNGWMTLPIDPERPELGTRRVFKPNFEIGADLYICNKELLETLIELGIQKVRDTPEAYGMKEGVEARDVVVDVAKDLMDSARHGYRANLKKQQEDEADAKAKSTRYKQQERHRTKVRNREVGAKRLRHPIPDSLLTMGLHSDDAASDQDDMHKMDKDEWRRTRQRKLQSKRGWEALSPRWRNPHLTKAYHIADTLSKSKQMPRWRRDGGVDLDPPSRLWGKTLPKVVFDPVWLAENEARIKEDPFHITVEDRPVPGWKDEEHGLSDDTEDELERFEREVARVQRAARKKTAGTATSSSAAATYSMGMGSGSRDGNMAGDGAGGRQHSSSASSPASGRSEGQAASRAQGRGRSDSGMGGGEDGDADDEGQTHDDDGPVGMSMDVDHDGRPHSSMDMLPKFGGGGGGGAPNSYVGPPSGPVTTNNSNSNTPVGPSLLHQTVDLV